MSRLSFWAPTLTVFATPMPSLAQGAGPYFYGPHMWDGGGWHPWFFGPIMMILFLAVAVVVIVLLVRWLGVAGHTTTPFHASVRTPLDILKERFARGEIDKDEFEDRRRVLGE